MKNNKFTKNDLIELLIKKASGFYYSEEQYEYEKTQNKLKKNEISYNNLNFFENYDRGCNNSESFDDKLKVSNETEISGKNDQTQNLTLVKKKVATHYISPDINAIKILFEIFENKVGEDSVENLTDEELLNLKNKLIKELSNDFNKD